VKPKTRNQRSELTGLVDHRETRWLPSKRTLSARQDAAGRVFGPVWNSADLFLQSKPRSLAGYQDPLLTLILSQSVYHYYAEKQLAPSKWYLPILDAQPCQQAQALLSVTLSYIFNHCWWGGGAEKLCSLTEFCQCPRKLKYVQLHECCCVAPAAEGFIWRPCLINQLFFCGVLFKARMRVWTCLMNHSP